MKQGETTESQVKGEIHEQVTNNKKHQSPEFPEIGNVGVPEFSGNCQGHSCPSSNHVALYGMGVPH